MDTTNTNNKVIKIWKPQIIKNTLLQVKEEGGVKEEINLIYLYDRRMKSGIQDYIQGKKLETVSTSVY